MKRPELRILLIWLLPILVIICAYSSIRFIHDSEYVLARFELGNGREILLEGAIFFEMAEPLYYSVRGGVKPVPRSFIHGYVSDHSYIVKFAEPVAAVYTTDNLVDPIAIYDFATGETWPHAGRYEFGYGEAWDARKARLHALAAAEHPDVKMIYPNAINWSNWLRQGACFGLPVFALMTIYVWGTAIITRLQRWRAHNSIGDSPRCRTCGYNLTGNVSGICPECGTDLSISESSTTQ